MSQSSFWHRASVGVSVVMATAFIASSSLAQNLPSDPRVITGVLDNGMTYKVRSHAKPAGHLAMYLHVSSGSLNETDPQRGIAHYLEHMAFNGSENFPPGTVIKMFESLGLTFGQHQNAFTSFDQTTYILDLNKTDDATIDTGMKFLSDVAFNLLLDPTEIEEERQVIMNEKRTRLSGRQRVQEYVLKNTAPGSLLGERLPIGVEETILGVKQQDFKDYYGKWYVPTNMTLMVVGDKDADALIADIKKHFSQGTKVAVPKDVPAGVRADDKPRAIVASDAEITRASIAIQKIEPADAPTTTEPQLRQDFAEMMAMQAFNRRLRDKVSKGEVSFQGGGAGVQNLANTIKMAGATASGEGEKWEAMLQDIAREVVRTRKFGFDQREMEDVTKEFFAGLEQAVETESGLTASAILRGMNTAIADGEPNLSAQQELDLAKKLIPLVKLDEVNAAFKAAFTGNMLYTLQLPQKEGVKIPTEAELVSMGEAAMSVDVKAEVQAARAEKLMEKLPTPGTIASQHEHEASHVWTGDLSNHACAHHYFNDDTKNEASVSITLYGGELLETAENRGITDAALTAWQRQATKHLSSTDIVNLMTGKKVGVRGGGGSNSIRLTVGGNPEELETGLQLAYLLLTQPKIEKAAFDLWKTSTLQGIDQREKDLDGVFGRVMGETIYPTTDARTQAVTKAQVEKITLEEAQAWLNRLIATSPIEVAFIGDLPRGKALELATNYIAALPVRDRFDASAFASLRTLGSPVGGKNVDAKLETETKKANAMVGFYGPDEANVVDMRRMQMAARILTSRLIKVVREEKQLVYSIRAGVRPDTTFPGYGLFAASAPCKPENAVELTKVLKQMMADFAMSGITEAELTTAKKQVQTTLDEEMKKAQYWAGWITNLSWSGRNLDDAVTAKEAYAAMTTEEILATYKKYCTPEKTLSVIVRGKNEDSPKDAAAAPATTKTGAATK
jgi:zinc protease